MTKKNLSISVFFPCYNDAGTIGSMVELATLTCRQIAKKFEIIVVDDGSEDNSRQILRELTKINSYLRLVFHEKNRGYGGALISGFTAATLDWVFYTDGDAQYDVAELALLAKKVSDKIDIVQGYKIKRHDPWYRIVIGNIYNFGVKLAFDIKITDVDCDFRLIRRSVFDKVRLTHQSGVITVEMVKKIQETGFKFAEVPVAHYNRTYGSSQIFNWRRLIRVAVELLQLWQELVLSKWIKTDTSKIKGS